MTEIRADRDLVLRIPECIAHALCAVMGRMKRGDAHIHRCVTEIVYKP